MATVRMKKGDKYADIFDSPDTIKQAQFEGYSLCEEKKPTADVEVKTKVEESKEDTSEKKPKTARQ